MKPNALGLPAPGLNSEPRELRQAERAWTDLPVDVLMNGSSHPCRVMDISLTGMLIELTKPLALGAPHLLDSYALHVNATEVLTVKARTVWRQGAKQAVCFVGLSEDDRLVVAELVEDAAWRLVSDVERLEIAELRDWLDEVSPHPGGR